MAGNRDELYRWKRLTSKNKPQNAVTKKSNKPSNDIQDWIKKVEDASNQAAAAAFGVPARGHRSNGYNTMEATLDVVHDHDEAYQEAQDLLSQWMAEKCNLDDHMTFEDEHDVYEGDVESIRSPGVKSDLKSHWDEMLERNDPSLISTSKCTSSDAMYAAIESRDDYSTVRSILGSMMEKELIEPEQKKRLRVTNEEKKRPDPRTTMAARQQKVKENRERREQERRQEMVDRQVRKAAEHQARQVVQREEKEKVMRAQKEELMIRDEMARIRKEMQEGKRQEEEARNREKAVEVEAHGQEGMKRKKEEEVMRRIDGARCLQEEQKRRETLKTRVEEAEQAHRLRILQGHFHAWYQLVLDQRLQLGKARALADWRRLLRAWNAWRAFIRACQAEREAKQTQMDIKLTHRRKLAADNHYRQRVLQKTFSAWQVFCHQESLEKEQSQQQNQTRSKMAAFLEAAASGKLWTNRGEEEMDRVGDSQSAIETCSDKLVSADRSVDAMFGNGASDPISSRSDPSPRATTTLGKPEKGLRHQSSRKPKHAWQVTRKHLNLTTEEIANIGDNMAQFVNGIPRDDQPPSAGKQLVQAKRPIPYTVNNFEHRYAAQQRLLGEQQEQLREQKWLIEELQEAHKQQGLKSQLQQIRNGEFVQGMEDSDGHPLDQMFHREGVSTRSDGDETSRTAMSGDSSPTSQSGNKTRPAPILKGMEERAAQRAKLKAEREERHRQREQQILAQLQAEEERKRAAEEAEKKAAIEKRREEKRLVKQREFEKQRRLEVAQSQLAQAEAHYQTSLLRRHGFIPWCRLVQTAKRNMQVAVDHHSHTLLQTCLMSWHHMTQKVIQHKNDLADMRYNEILLRRSFNSWKRFGHYQSIQLQRARRHYLLRLRAKVLSAWRDWAMEERLRAWKAEEMAEEHDTSRIMRTVFRAWRRYPRMLKEEQKREIRRQEMRRKVASMIPDFGLI